MAFQIHYEGKLYKGFSFIEFPFQNDFEKSIIDILRKWQELDVKFVFRTSGTTGKPKEIFFSKDDLIASARASIEALELLKEKQHILLCLPCNFVGGAMMLIRALVLDCDISIFTPGSDILSRIEDKHTYTFASFVPLQLQHQGFSEDKFKRFRTVLIGGTTMPHKLEMLLSQSNNYVYHTYGLTEALSHVALRRIGKQKGYKAIAPYEISIQENSCLVIGGGFLKGPIETHDRAKFLDDGSFILLGRTDFVINSGGVKIHPEELEMVLSKHESFGSQELFIGKASNAQLGEECVLVARDPFGPQTFLQVKEYLLKEGYHYEIPKRYLIVKEIPRNENGKLDRIKLNEYIDNQPVL